MQEQLFIPKIIKVGYQKRSDTYSKQLAYVIYYDDKGKLRKETSWEGWRDKSITPKEFDNNPHQGFYLNRDVQRGSDWFGSGRSMIRIYDDRGIEFEITTTNLMFILMITNCYNRQLEGKFVYSWYGKELVLLPIGCSEYEKASNFTALQKQKVSAKTLKPGFVYQTKKQIDLVYLGKFDWWNFSDFLNRNQQNERSRANQPVVMYQKATNYHIFWNSKYNKLETMTSLTNLANEKSEFDKEKFTKLLDKFSKLHVSSPIVDVKEERLHFDFGNEKWYNSSNGQFFLKKDENSWIECSIYKQKNWSMGKYVLKGFTMHEINLLEFKNNKLTKTSIPIPARNTGLSSLFSYKKDYISLKEISDKEFYSIKIITENGNKMDFSKLLYPIYEFKI
jgi:hypothetical protein